MGIDLKNISYKAAFYEAKRQSGMTNEQIADRMTEIYGDEIKPSTVQSWTDPYKFKQTPPYWLLHAFCEAVGNTVVLEWPKAQMEQDSEQGFRSGVELLKNVSSLGCEFGDVCCAVNNSLSGDNCISYDEAQEIRGELDDVINTANNLKKRLLPVAGQVFRKGKFDRVTIPMEAEGGAA